MSNNSVSFGSTTIFYNGMKNTSIQRHVNKLLKSGKFTEIKKIDNLAASKSALQPGQIGLLNDAKGVTLTGYNAKEDQLIYDILTSNGKKRLPGSSYVTDHLDITV